MRCHYTKCDEPIEFGEACIQEPANVTLKTWLFHPGCHAKWVAEQAEQERRLQHVREMAGQIH